MVEEYRQAYESVQGYEDKKKILNSLIGHLPEDVAVNYAIFITDLQNKINVLGSLDYDVRDQVIRDIHKELDNNFYNAIEFFSNVKSR